MVLGMGMDAKARLEGKLININDIEFFPIGLKLGRYPAVEAVVICAIPPVNESARFKVLAA